MKGGMRSRLSVHSAKKPEGRRYSSVSPVSELGFSKRQVGQFFTALHQTEALADNGACLHRRIVCLSVK